MGRPPSKTRATAEPSTELERALAPLAKLLAAALAPMVAAELAHAVDRDPWVAHPDWPFSRRKSLRLARANEIAGVRRDGRTYFARRSAIDQYLDARPVVAQVLSDDPPRDDDGPTQEELLASWGHELAPGARRRGRGGT